MPVFNNILAGAAGQVAGGGDDAGYKIDRSLRFNNASLYKDFSGGHHLKWAWAGWVKRSALGSSFIFQGGTTDFNDDGLLFNSNNKLQISFHNGSNALNGQLITSATYVDCSAWMHICLVSDTGNSVGNDRMRLYVNGLRITQFDTNNNPTVGTSSHDINKASRHHIGSFRGSSSMFLGMMAECYFLDGHLPATATDDASGSVTGTPSAEYLTDFGEFNSTTGVWDPKQYTFPAAVKHKGDWIGDTTGSAFNSNDDTQIHNTFDGYSSTGGVAQAGTSFVFTPSSPITGISKVRLKVQRDSQQTDDHDLKLNGTNIGGSWSTGTTATVEFTVTNLTSLQWATKSNQHWYRVYTIEIYYDGAYHYLEQADTNNFHLDFSDNSSKAALGDDRSRPDYNKLSGALTTTSGSGNFYSGTADRAFDGSTATDVKGGWQTTGDTSNLIWSPPTGAYSVSSSLRVVCGYYSTIYVNNVSKSTSDGSTGATGWITLNHTGAINSIKFENATNDNVVRIYAIEVDGTVLTSNAWTVNNFEAGTSYSVANSITSSLTLSGASYILNGLTNYDATMSNSGTGAWIEFNPPGGIAYSNKVEVMASNNPSDNMRLQLNGGSLVNTVNSNTYVTLATGSGTINKIRLQGDTGLFRWRSIRVDGVVLQEITSGNDSLLDSPTNYSSGGNIGGNYCTLNALSQSSGGFSEGGLRFVGPGSWTVAYGTMAFTSGKWYYEVTLVNAPYGQGSGQDHSGFGWGEYKTNDTTSPSSITTAVFLSETGWYKNFTGSKTNASQVFAPGDVLSVAVDLDANTFEFKRNGTSVVSGTMARTPGRALAPFFVSYNASYGEMVFNFGQQPFQQSIPAGYNPLCTQVFDAPVEKGADHFDILKYQGNGASTVGGSGSTQDFSTFAFAPGMVWIKDLEASNHNHNIADIVRGAPNLVLPDADNGEITNSTNGFTGFTDDGFTLGVNNDGSQSLELNKLGNHIIAWAWNAGNLVTSSAYNQSQTWSSGMKTTTTATATYSTTGRTTTFPEGTNKTPFNGSLTDYLYSKDGVQGTWWFLEFATALTNVTSIEFSTEYSCPNGIIKLNGTDVAVNQSDIQGGYVTVSVTGTIPSSLTEIAVQGYQGSARLKWVKINGKYLFDPGVVPVGSLNSSVYNQGTTNYTTSQVTGNDYNSTSFGATNGMFDGQRNTIRAASSQSTFTWTTSITPTTLRLMVHKEGGTTTINITDSNGQRNIASLFPTTSNSDVTNSKLEFVNVPVSGTVTEIEVNADPSGTGYQAGIAMVELDGKILVDNGVTPPNVPSQAGTVSANQAAGFSVIKSAPMPAGNVSLAHGLNRKPHMVMRKRLDAASNWYVAIDTSDIEGYMLLDTADALTNQSVGLTENDFYVAYTGGTAEEWINYAFAPVPNYSAMGTYIGGGSTNVVVHTGFRPRFVMLKNTSTSNSTGAGWIMIDTERDIDNNASNYLTADTTASQGNTTVMDIFSNGFRLTNPYTSTNATGIKYFYYAVAESPFKYSRAR